MVVVVVVASKLLASVQPGKGIEYSPIDLSELVAFFALDQVLELADVPSLVCAVWIHEWRWQPLHGKPLAGDSRSNWDEDVEHSLSQEAQKSCVAGDGLVVIHPAFHFRIIRVCKGDAETSDFDASFVGEANPNNSEALFTALGVRKSVKKRY